MLAEELRTERANAENVSHGIGVPSLRQHRNGHYAADGTTKLSGLADRIHDLAQQFLVGDVVASVGVAGALDNFTTKAVYFVRSHRAEIVVQRVTGFKLLAIDKERVGTWERVAGSFIEVSEQSEASVHGRRSPVGVLANKAGDEVVNEFGDRGVLADDDEARRHLNAFFFPQLEGLLIVPVERFQRRLQSRREFERIKFFAFATPFRRHVLANVLPQVTEHRHLVAGDVFRDGDAR